MDANTLAKMSDRELDLAAAATVMEGMAHHWCPSINMADAWDIVTKMRSEGRYFEIGATFEDDPNHTTCVFGLLRAADPNGDRPIVVTAPTVGRAICIAAILAVSP